MSAPHFTDIRALIITRWVLAILRGDKTAFRMYKRMLMGKPEF